MAETTLVADRGDPAVPVQAIGTEDIEAALQNLPERDRRFAAAQGFKADAGRCVFIPDEAGNIGRVLFG